MSKLCQNPSIDDPAYFGGYVNENYKAVANALPLTRDDICALARNSFHASFLAESEKAEMIAKLAAYVGGQVAAQESY